MFPSGDPYRRRNGAGGFRPQNDVRSFFVHHRTCGLGRQVWRRLADQGWTLSRLTAASYHWLHQDRQGSVIAVSDAAGVVTPYAYGPYGEPQSWAGSRLRYTGQMAIAEAQLYHYRARAYDPLKGRFLQTDPIGYGDGLNVYAYVHGDPVNAVDPDGLADDVSPLDVSPTCWGSTGYKDILPPCGVPFDQNLWATPYGHGYGDEKGAEVDGLRELARLGIGKDVAKPPLRACTTADVVSFAARRAGDGMTTLSIGAALIGQYAKSEGVPSVGAVADLLSVAAAAFAALATITEGTADFIAEGNIETAFKAAAEKGLGSATGLDKLGRYGSIYKDLAPVLADKLSDAFKVDLSKNPACKKD